MPGLTLDTAAQDGKLSDVRRMAAGFAAGITEALVIVTPFEVVKIRLQQQRGQSKELLRYKVRLSHTHIYHGRIISCYT
jgi:solute carrier family 25 citrate transporter 1